MSPLTPIAEQRHRNPDDSGIGVFGPDGTPLVVKQPVAAWDDIAFATAARELTGRQRAVAAAAARRWYGR